MEGEVERDHNTVEHHQDTAVRPQGQDIHRQSRGQPTEGLRSPATVGETHHTAAILHDGTDGPDQETEEIRQVAYLV